jgi:hypothetical protein
MNLVSTVTKLASGLLAENLAEKHAPQEREVMWTRIRQGVKESNNGIVDKLELAASKYVPLFSELLSEKYAPCEREAMWRKIRQGVRGPAADYVYGKFGALANRFMLPLFIEHRPDFHYAFEKLPDYEELFDGWIAGNLSNNCGDLTRFYMLYQNVSHVLGEGVPGDLVELGVYKGNSAKLLAVLGAKHGRHVYLFDTFAGFDERDFKGADAHRQATWHRGHFTDTSVEGVQKLIDRDNVTCVKGFFPESTANMTLPEKIAVAHIDCDLYEPMKAALEMFYPRVPPGGLIIMHDYSSGWWPGAKQAVDEFFADRPEKPVLMPDKSGTAVARRV